MTDRSLPQKQVHLVRIRRTVENCVCEGEPIEQTVINTNNGDSFSVRGTHTLPWGSDINIFMTKGHYDHSIKTGEPIYRADVKQYEVLGDDGFPRITSRPYSFYNTEVKIDEVD